MGYGNHRETGLGAVAETLIGVQPGRKCQVGVTNPSGNTFNVVGYFYNSEDASREQHILESGITDTNYCKTTQAGFVDIGIDVTVGGTTDMVLEVLECKLG